MSELQKQLQRLEERRIALEAEMAQRGELFSTDLEWIHRQMAKLSRQMGPELLKHPAFPR